jgi:hypothetical protein
MMARPLPLVALAMLAGCSSTPTRFWTVEPISAVAPPTAGRSLAPVQVTAVHVPLAIDRLEIVRHDSANRVTVLDFDRWSAPPGDLLRRTLTQDLITRRPTGSVVFPDAPAPPGTRAITVDILDWRQDGDRYLLQLSWAVAGKDAVSHPLSLRTPAGAGDVAAQTEALGRLTAELSDRIVTALGGPGA